VKKKFTVKDVMSTDLITLQEDETLDLVQQVMRLGRVRHLPVTRSGALVGLITHRDLLRASISALADIGEDERMELLSQVKVSEIMNKDIKTITLDQPLMKVAETLLVNRFGCLPVVGESGRLIGIVTEADFLRYSMVLTQQLDELEAAL